MPNVLRVGLSRDQGGLEQGRCSRKYRFIAPISVCLPFWGIMNTFIGLAAVDQVTLAAVAYLQALIKPQLVFLQQFQQCLHLTISLQKANLSILIAHYFEEMDTLYYNVSQLERHGKMHIGNQHSGRFDRKKHLKVF